MQKVVIYTLVIGFWVTVSSAGYAGDKHLVPDAKWNEDLKVWLARAMVAEAGWDNATDHVAIAYVLLRRWKIARRSFPRISMVSVIRNYCAGLDRIARTPRQSWVRTLKSDGSRPKHWPGDISWQDYKQRWTSVLETVEQWREGLHPDPCNGLSRYWGGPLDKASKRMVKMDCGETKNTFYTVRTLVEN